ncbi:PREDICTED: uncharacterized protein LOC104814655 [Tarenaya hassleriana]|uniref:uncharacterized protein LOC104814655 n=1 Tax=Tarenaya hassleriana TaxID=28532 RepID=UPI00053C8A16|nr:PREDICTED: uncharacterized protein LOC104814655 [Tarenaya hassleriana]XP_010541119.1 PREDICTED: uncharacterized protein LOC104814655 [Tarenaya hassleriana]
MSRLLSKIVIPRGRFLPLRFPAPAPASEAFFRRRFSSEPQFVEIDLDSSSSSSQAEARAEFIKELNDMVRRLIVHKSTPDWLPFIPGSSFWVPPSRKTTSEIVDLVDKVTNRLSEEESLSVMSLRGWPRSSFFIPSDDSAPTEEVEADTGFKIAENEVLEVKIELLPNSDDES